MTTAGRFALTRVGSLSKRVHDKKFESRITRAAFAHKNYAFSVSCHRMKDTENIFPAEVTVRFFLAVSIDGQVRSQCVNEPSPNHRS